MILPGASGVLLERPESGAPKANSRDPLDQRTALTITTHFGVSNRSCAHCGPSVHFGSFAAVVGFVRVLGGGRIGGAGAGARTRGAAAVDHDQRRTGDRDSRGSNIYEA